MWGWFDSFISGLESIWQGITELPSKIKDSLSDFFNGVIDAITGLPTLILDGLKEIFIPDTEVLSAQFDGLIESIENKLGLTTDSIEILTENIQEIPVSDANSEYKISGVGTFNLTFMDTEFLRDAIAYFRPLIRGFIFLLLIFFNFKQLLSFIGQDPSIAHNAQQDYQAWKEGDK